MKASDGVAQAAEWRDLALGIARDLAVRAVWSDGLCAFHGATSPESLRHPPRFRSLGGDVYEGSSGIARFLGTAAALSGEATLRSTALGAMRHAFAVTNDWPLFTGGMGTGIVALELAERLDQPDLVPTATRMIESASDSALAATTPLDFLTGTAGVVIGLTAALRYDLDGGWRTRALELGNRLLAAAVVERSEGSEPRTLSWPLTPGQPECLCGLAHGASGMALAFEALARMAPDDARWRTAARLARDFERTHYSREAGSWADLRPRESDAPELAPSYPHLWCHGSIGVAAERLGAVQHDLLGRADAVAGLAGARAHARRLLDGPAGPGANDGLNGSLCHGLAGLIDLFVDAWQATADTGWMALAGELAELMRNDARRKGGWRSGVPGGWSAPGLMLGNAGIGWAFLRLAEPELVPSGWRLGPRSAGLNEPTPISGGAPETPESTPPLSGP